MAPCFQVNPIWTKCRAVPGQGLGGHLTAGAREEERAAGLVLVVIVLLAGVLPCWDSRMPHTVIAGWAPQPREHVFLGKVTSPSMDDWLIFLPAMPIIHVT